MAKPSDKPGFSALLAEWNRKLSDAGFTDIEGSHQELKRTGTMNRALSPDVKWEAIRQAKQEYYLRIGRCVEETVFSDPIEESIMRMYSEGVPQTEIQRRLGIEGHRCKVYRPLHQWLKRWGLK